MTYADDFAALGAKLDTDLAALRKRLDALEARPTTPPPVTPPPTAGRDNKYGFMVFLGAGTAGVDKDVAGIVEAGGTWARLGMFDSGSFTNAGVFQPNAQTWDLFEYACKAAKAAGLKVCWDAADTLRISNTLTNAQWITWQQSMWRYMSARLWQWVDMWQVFNEHDGRNLRTFAPQDNLLPANLAFFRAALEGARDAIREGNSSAPVGTTTFGWPVNEDRIQKAWKLHDGVSVNMDYIGLHAYPEYNGQALASFVSRTADRYGKPVAVLEFGMPDGGYQRVGDGIVAQNDGLLSVKDKLLCVALFSLRNRVQGGTGEGGFGIVDADWAKKPYWRQVVDSVKRWG